MKMIINKNNKSVCNTMSFITIPYLNKPAWIRDDRTFFAIGHYNKPIPFVLKAGSEIKLSTNYPCHVLVLNNDRRNEQRFENFTNDLTVSIEFDSVVFINCIYVDNSLGEFYVSYQIDGEHEPLQHLICKQHNDLVDESLSLVFVEGDVIQLLVAQTDLRHLNGLLENDAQLLQLNHYYSDIINCYDELTGINFHRKYFAKADAGGPSAGFYGRFFMGESSPSMRSFYLTPNISNWGGMHEIAHSFDVYFVSNTSQVHLQEVWTNIFPDYYQYTRFTPEQYLELGWKFQNNQTTLLTTLKSMFGNVLLDDWNVRNKLIYLTTFFFKVGHKKLLTDMFDYMIDLIINDQFDVNKFRVFDMIIYFLDKYGIDVIYVNQVVGLRLIDKIFVQSVKCNLNNTVNVYEFMIVEDSINFILISSTPGTAQNAKLTFAKVHPEQLIGAPYTLVNNTNNVFSSTFTSNTTEQSLSSIPAGCYKFFYQSGNSTTRYFCDTDYIVITNAPAPTKTAPPVPLEFYTVEHSFLLNETFVVHGVANWHVADLNVNYFENMYTLQVFIDSPHSVFATEIYYSFKIDDQVTWEFVGGNNNLTQRIFTYPLAIGQTLETYHREPGRLISDFTTPLATNEFIVTAKGLHHTTTTVEDTLARLVEKIFNFCMSNQSISTSSYIQDNIFLVFNILPKQQQNYLHDSVKPFLPNISVTSITALNTDNTNIIRANIKDGIMEITTFYKNFLQNTVYFEIIRSNRPVYRIFVDFDDTLHASVEYFVLRNRDIIRMDMFEFDNLRFVIIDGELQTNLKQSSIEYMWYNNTLMKPNEVPASPENIIGTIVLLLGLFIILFILLLIMYVTCMNKPVQIVALQSPPPRSSLRRQIARLR